MRTEPYLRNVWCAAALGDDPTDNLLRRTIRDEPVLLFRDQERGAATALLDRCPHRFAPLSLGKRAAGGSKTGIFALRPLGLIGDAGGVRAGEKLRQRLAAGQGAAVTSRPVDAHRH